MDFVNAKQYLITFIRYRWQELNLLFSFVIVGVTVTLIYHASGWVSTQDVHAALVAVAPAAILYAILGTFISFGLLALNEGFGILYAEERLSPKRFAFVSFVAFGVSNTISFAALASTSIRIRLYSRWNVPGSKILKVIAFSSSGVWISFLALAGASVILNSVPVPQEFALNPAWTKLLGAVFLLIVAGYLYLARTRKLLSKFMNSEFRVPNLRLAFAQITLGALDWSAAAFVLYVLLPVGLRTGFAPFLSVFLLVQIVSMISHVPGGLGVLEVLAIYFLEPTHKVSPGLAAALILYRAIYYGFPFISALLLMLVYEISQSTHILAVMVKRVLRGMKLGVPNVISVIVLVAGGILLWSGSTPTEVERLRMLKKVLPLATINFSHLMASVVGTGLLVLANGLRARSSAAWTLTLVMMMMGAAFSLLKGFDFEESLILVSFVGLLLVSRDEFYRSAPLFSEPMSQRWILSIIGIVSGTLFMAFVNFPGIKEGSESWWSFFVRGDGPRFLRASLGVVAALTGICFWRLLTPRLPGHKRGVQGNVAEVLPLVQSARGTMASLALLGDKSTMLSQARDGFVMYAVRGKSWISLGDPVTGETSFNTTLREFKTLADRYGGWPVFYQVQPRNLTNYVDLGFQLIKLGEEARVNLAEFTLEGRERKGLRNTINRIEKESVQFAIIDKSEIHLILPRLKEISTQWLKNKRLKEMGFSVGFFDDEYLQNFSCAVLKKDGEIIAFANIWEAAQKEELSVDLMRHIDQSPSGTMDYLFLRLMLWGKDNGYCWFNLGMAPLSGLDSGSIDTAWNTFGHMIYNTAEPIYNFKGVRAFKEKFLPTWESRYLAYPSNLSLPLVLADLAVLINGGSRTGKTVRIEKATG